MSLVMTTASAPRVAPSDESVSVDRNSAIAPTPSIEKPTYSIAAPMRSTTWVGVSVGPLTEATTLTVVVPGCGGKSETPMRYPETATATTAPITKTTIDTSFATSRRVRPTGRASRYRSMPALASPATASPPTIATATGRKIGRTIASAAAANSEPLASTAARNAGPCPCPVPTRVVARNTATVAGRPHSSAMLTQVRGRRYSLRSSTAIMLRLLVRSQARSRVHPVRAVGGVCQHDLLEGAPFGSDLADPQPFADQPG